VRFQQDLEKVAGAGFEHLADSSGNSAVDDLCGAKSGAIATDLPSELQELIERWPTLPDALKAGILAMVRSAAT
jgi:hypothetical protein